MRLAVAGERVRVGEALIERPAIDVVARGRGVAAGGRRLRAGAGGGESERQVQAIGGDTRAVAHASLPVHAGAAAPVRGRGRRASVGAAMSGEDSQMR